MNAAEFSFNYEHVGRSVTDPVDFNNRMPAAFFGSTENAEFAVPQIVYCENVMPYAKGIFSVGFGIITNPVTPADDTFDQAIVLRDEFENQATFSPALGKNYVLNPETGIWTSVDPFNFSAGSLVTRAYVNGRSFICYERTKILEYVAGTLVPVSLTFPVGTVITDVRGIGYASNYLLLFTDLAVYWCSPLNIFDFADLDQGAGQSIPTDIRGSITALLPCGGGFIAYTARNAVAAKYTNNGISPFAFKEIANAGGVASFEQVTADSSDAAHYIWGTNGLQQVALDGSTIIHPQMSDYLVGGMRSTWNSVTKQVVTESIAGAYTVKLSFLTGRYLVISYGELRNSFDGCFVLDVPMQRWGKLIIKHVDAFIYAYPTLSKDYDYDDLVGYYSDFYQDSYQDLSIVKTITIPPKVGLSFLKSTGQIDTVNLAFNQPDSNGVAILGRIQQRHSKNVTFQDVTIDGLRDTPTPTVSLLGSYKGDVRDFVAPMQLVEVTGSYKKYSARVTACNFDVAIEGNFQTSSILLNVMNHGYR